jgi:hypothetical protein
MSISYLKHTISVSEENSMIEKCQYLVRKINFFEKVNWHIFLKFNDIFISMLKIFGFRGAEALSGEPGMRFSGK